MFHNRLFLVIVICVSVLAALLVVPSPTQAQICSGSGTGTWTLYTCDSVRGCIANVNNATYACGNTTGANTCPGAQCGYCVPGGESCTQQGTFGNYTCTIQNNVNGQYTPPCLSFAKLQYNGCSCQNPNCNQEPVTCGACYWNGVNNTCARNGNQDCYYTTYSGGGACNQTYAWTNYGVCSFNKCNVTYTCTSGTCVTTVSGNVYTDYNHNGTKDTGDSNYQGATVSTTGTSATTDGNGNYSLSLQSGNYSISVTLPANYAASTANPVGVSLGSATTVNFGITPLYSISGNVFLDANKNQKFDATETGYGGGTIHFSGGPTNVSDITVAGNGSYTSPTTLESGTYTVSYTGTLPAGYTFTTPSSFTVTVGDPAGSPACNTGGSLDAVCGGTNNGSISKLDFGLTNENAWNQSVCFDVRNDSGMYTDLIPANPSCGGVSGAYNSITNADCSTGAGIIFTCNATPDFGVGSANANNWQAGGTGANLQECYVGPGLNVIRTSYNYLLTTARQSNITPIDMGTVCGAGGIANCTLPSTLAKGVYLAQGNVNLNAYTFPVDPTTPQGFIFLINGDLHLLGNVLVPAGSVATFSTSGSIYVDPSVGNVIANPSDPAVNNPNLEGLYSADANFVVQSYTSGTNLCNADGTPLDKKLNIVGSVVTNAGQGGGAFLNNRDLCIYDLQCPAVSTGDGTGSNSGLALSYLLSLYGDGKFLNHKIYNWQEVRP